MVVIMGKNGIGIFLVNDEQASHTLNQFLSTHSLEYSEMGEKKNCEEKNVLGKITNFFLNN